MINLQKEDVEEREREANLVKRAIKAIYIIYINNSKKY